MQNFSIIVRPELCVGCRQCMIRCAEAHSGQKELSASIEETPLAKPRVYVVAAPGNKAFPSKCRHCEPAPCQSVCIPGAIRSDIYPGLKVVDPNLCIGCTMCAMACPYYAIRFFQDWKSPEKFKTAMKCDGCYERLEEGLIPACAEACKTGAITWGDENLIWEKATSNMDQGLCEPGK